MGALPLLPAAVRPRALAAGATWPAVVVLAAGALALALSVSLQVALAGLLVFLVAALYVWRPEAGVVALFAFWLLAPGLRRLVAASTGYVDADPLALAPFAATAVVAAIALVRAPLTPRIGRLLACAGAGYLVGLPIGLMVAPPAAVFALVAYGAGVSAAVIALTLSPTGAAAALRRSLVWLLPLIALYGIAQHLAGPTRWDQAWLDTVDVITFGAPGQEGRVRVFATLNSPGTLAGLLSVGLLLHLAARRTRPLVLLPVAALLLALAFTYVRSAWVAIVVAALAHVAATHGRSAARVGGTLALAVVSALALASVAPPAAALVERVGTLGAVQEDESAQARIATPQALLSTAATAPLGHGLGQAGEATRLGGSERLRHSDNAYLALLYQSGPLGFALVLAPLGVALAAAWRGARRRGAGHDVRAGLFAVLVFCLVFSTTGDHFYGAVAIVFWFVAGAVLGEADRPAPRMSERGAGSTA